MSPLRKVLNNMSTLAHFQALLFDVDNTLTTSQRVITPELKTHLKTLADRGYVLGVCTGRGGAMLQSYVFPHFPKDALHITTGGSQVIKSDGTVVWEKLFADELAQEILMGLADLKADYMVLQEQYVAASASFLPRLLNHPFGGNPQDILNCQLKGVPLIAVFNISPAVEAFLGQFSDRATFKWNTQNQDNTKSHCDITAHGVTKAAGLEKWSELMSIQLNEVIGFGDSANDVEFLKAVGFSVAMGNANEEIKKLSKRVIGTNDDNGLATYLSSIIQGDSL